MDKTIDVNHPAQESTDIGGQLFRVDSHSFDFVYIVYVDSIQVLHNQEFLGCWSIHSRYDAIYLVLLDKLFDLLDVGSLQSKIELFRKIFRHFLNQPTVSEILKIMLTHLDEGSKESQIEPSVFNESPMLHLYSHLLTIQQFCSMNLSNRC